MLTGADRQPFVTLALFPDAVFRAAFEKMDEPRSGQSVWQGRLEGIEDGEVTIAVTDGAVAGQVTMPGAQYRIRYLAAGLHAVEQLDTSRLPRHSEPLVPDPPPLVQADLVPGPERDDGSLIDVMVMFTPAARMAAGGSASMTSVVNLAVASTNNAYANSGVTQRLRLVYSGEIAYTESVVNGSYDDLARLQNPGDGIMDTVHTLRNLYKADFVSLLTNAYDACGLGYLMTTVSPSFQAFAFNVAAWDCAAAELALAHELGHNMGLAHDVANSGGEGAYPYAYGYRDPGYFRTVMAYDCRDIFSSCPRVPHFSTPTRTYGGRPTGVPGASDNARALNNTAPVTANFRIAPICTFSLSSANGNTPNGGGSGVVILTASDPGCGWAASSHSAFLAVSPASGYGTATLIYTASPYGGVTARTGTLTIAGLSFTVYQAGTVQRRRADFNGDGADDVAVFRPSTGRFYVNNGSSVGWGAPGDIPVVADYDGDRRTDYAVWRPSIGRWYVFNGEVVDWGAPGDIPVPGDYDGDGRTDFAVLRPATMQWFVRNIGAFQWGATGDIPVQADWDGDGDTDIGVWRPRTGTWFIMGHSGVVWGQSGDVPVPADYDGNGTIDIAVWRPATGTWYVKDQFSRGWGAAGDIPVPLDRTGDGRAELGLFRGPANGWFFLNTLASQVETVGWGIVADLPLGRPLPLRQSSRGDFDGDWKSDLTVFRPSNGSWMSLTSVSDFASTTTRVLGAADDLPLAGDWDGDGLNDPAVYRASTHMWYAQRSSSGYTQYDVKNFGLAGDLPVPADYDGDRRMDFAMFRPSSGLWLIYLSSTGSATQVQYSFGARGDVPVPGDYDGDGRADIALFRPSTGRWYILDRFTGVNTTYQFGSALDTPVPADYDGDGRFDVAVYRASAGRWYVLQSSLQFAAYTYHDFGGSSDTPVPADYDGDGRADIAVFRPSIGRWYVLHRFQGTYLYRDSAIAGDLPVTKWPM